MMETLRDEKKEATSQEERPMVNKELERRKITRQDEDSNT